jgi:mRNA interferase MazF
MKSRAYVPERGDAIWLDFDPQAGREQAGCRHLLWWW